MLQMYRPCTLRFRLENLILDDVCDDTVSFTINNRRQLGTDVQVDRSTGLVYITSLFSWEEMAEYSLVFSKRLRFLSGRLLLRNYAVSLQIKDGKFYTRSNASALPGSDLFVPENLFRYTRIVSAYFDGTTHQVSLTYPGDDPALKDPEEDEENRAGGGKAT